MISAAQKLVPRLVQRLSQRQPRRVRAYDVVFYTPWIGSILSARESSPPGGAETQILMLSGTLARRGMRVAIVVFGARAELPSEVDGVSIVARPPYRTPVGLVDKLLEVFQLWRSLWRAPSRTIVQRGAGIELGLIAVFARITGRRLVYSSASPTDFDAHKIILSRGYLMIHELGVRLAHTIVVQSEEQRELCERRFGRRPRLIKSLAPLAEPQNDFPEAFLWVGRFNSYKRPLEYIELARSLPEAHFWMIGVPTPHHEGDRRLTVRATAEAATVSNLELLAPRPHAEVGKLMSRAVASVSTSDFEGMPNVLLEGWSRGVPALVLTHDPDGVVSAHGLGGFADGSFERLVALAREQWATRNDRDELSRRCRAYIEQHHAPELVAEQWLDVLSFTTHATRIQMPVGTRH